MFRVKHKNLVVQWYHKSSQKSFSPRRNCYKGSIVFPVMKGWNTQLGDKLVAFFFKMLYTFLLRVLIKIFSSNKIYIILSPWGIKESLPVGFSMFRTVSSILIILIIFSKMSVTRQKMDESGWLASFIDSYRTRPSIGVWFWSTR